MFCCCELRRHFIELCCNKNTQINLCLFCRKFVKVEKVKCWPKCDGKLFPALFPFFALCLRVKLVFCFADIVAVTNQKCTTLSMKSHNRKIFSVSNGHRSRPQSKHCVLQSIFNFKLKFASSSWISDLI